MTVPAARPPLAARLLKALGALAALLLVVVGGPLVLIAIGAVPHGMPTGHAVAASLRSRDDTGAYFRIAGAAAVWIAWAIYTAITVKETAASIRFHGPRPALPRTGLSRLGPAALVAAIAVLFVAAPLSLPTVSSPASAQPLPRPVTGPAHPGIRPHTAAPASSPATEAVDGPTSPASASDHHPDAPVGPDVTTAAPLTLPTYEVQRYDSLWGIADHHLPGDPAARYHDIVDLNPGQVGPDNTIRPGQLLTLPADAYALPAASPAAGAVQEITVGPGDTLSGIAAAHGITDWPSVWPLNHDLTEPGGEHFTDPDHIEPGWHIEPTRAGGPTPDPTTPSTQPPTQPTPGPTPAPRTPPQTPAPTPRTPPQPTTSPPSSTPATPTTGSTAPPTPNTTTPTAGAGSGTPTPAGSSPAATSRAGELPARPGTHRSAWDGVFVGGAALLASGLLTTLIAYRRRQLRHRRPGHAVQPTPIQAVPAETALRTHGPLGRADVAFLDTALRHLSATIRDNPAITAPNILAARYRDEQLHLRLAEPSPTPPPAPWSSDTTGYWWTTRTSDDRPATTTDPTTQLAPYPTLVAIGDDTDGNRWLLDLEALGSLTLHGDIRRCTDLGRFLAAELAVNAWADGLHVTITGYETDLSALNPARLHHADNLAVAARQLAGDLRGAREASDRTGLDVLAGRMHAIAGDSWIPHILLALAPPTDPRTTDTDDAVVEEQVAHEAADGEALQQLLHDLHAVAARAATAVVLLPNRPGKIHTSPVTDGATETADDAVETAAIVDTLDAHADGYHAVLSGDGLLRIPALEIAVQAHQLHAEHVADLAEMFAQAGQVDDAPMPEATGVAAYHEFSDVAGGLRADLTHSRGSGTPAPAVDASASSHSDGEARRRRVSAAVSSGPAAARTATSIVLRATSAATGDHLADTQGEERPPVAGTAAASLLPHDDDEYLQAAATTAADLQTLAPRVDSADRDRIRAADPDLDADLADWRDRDSRTPKLRLLGPVELSAHGEPPTRRMSFHTEVVAFIATRDHGATVEQVAAAFDSSTGTIYKLINTIRAWLGSNPATGQKYLPDSTKSSAGRARGVGVYELTGALIDADLFKRLRVRGEALGGAEGIAYLEQALSLVAGRPFDQLRPGGYGWLAETPLDHYLTSAIVDVAHTVHLHHLNTGNWEPARAAAELALRAAPYEDTPRLDIVAVLHAEGHHDAAEQLLREQICNRSEDGDAPEDLPDRTAEILRRRRWASRAS